MIHASTNPTYSATATPVNIADGTRAASALVPVTNVPSGNTKLHHVNANGNPRRAVRTVTVAAVATHSRANPHVIVP